jgi:hypothetical protein
MRTFHTHNEDDEKIVFVEKFAGDHSALADAINLAGRTEAPVWETLSDGSVVKVHDWDEDESDEAPEYDDGMDGDHESALASAGFGTDESYGGGCEML